MYIDNFIIESSVEKEFSEIEKARMKYLTLTPEDLFMNKETFHFTGAKLSDYQGEKTISQQGRNYFRGRAIIDFYNDDFEKKITFFDTYFTRLDKKGNLVVNKRNVLSNIIREISGEHDKNKFKINYKGLQEAILYILGGNFDIIIINESKGYKTCGIKFNELVLKKDE